MQSAGDSAPTVSALAGHADEGLRPTKERHTDIYACDQSILGREFRGGAVCLFSVVRIVEPTALPAIGADQLKSPKHSQAAYQALSQRRIGFIDIVTYLAGGLTSVLQPGDRPRRRPLQSKICRTEFASTRHMPSGIAVGFCRDGPSHGQCDHHQNCRTDRSARESKCPA